MRTVHAYDYALAVAKYLDASTGLGLCGALVRERETELDRDIPLELRHETFFRVLAEEIWKEPVVNLTASVNVRKESTIAGIIVKAACNRTTEPVPDADHWESCSYHQDWLKHVFAIYLDCLTGKSLEEIAARNSDPAVALAEKLMQTLSAKGERVFARWGKVLLQPENLRLLARAMSDLSETEQSGVIGNILLAIASAENVPEPDEFALIVRRATELAEGEDMN